MTGRQETASVLPVQQLHRLEPDHRSDCPHPAVRVDRLEPFVLDALRQYVLETNAAERVKDAIVRAKSRHMKLASTDEKRLHAVRQKIERGTENLALAGRQDFAAISKLLTKWREEEAVTRGPHRTTTAVRLEPLPEALEVIAEFGDLRQKLKLADRVKLAHAVKQTVASITIGIRQAKTGQISRTPSTSASCGCTKPCAPSRSRFPTRPSAAARSGVRSATWSASPTVPCIWPTSASTSARRTCRVPLTTCGEPRRRG